MRTSNKLLILSLVVLYGCQPETPVPPPAVSTPAAQVEQPVASEVVTEEKVPQPIAEETPAQLSVSPAAAEHAIQPAASQATMEEKAPQPTVAKTPAQSTPVQVIGAPAEKANSVPVVAEVKSVLSSGPVISEADAMQLAKKNNCFVCHAIGKKMVGPSFKDIAVKYRNDPEAEALMMTRIAKGGSGVWGAMVMPPNPKINETDIRVLAKLVLSSK